MSDDEYEGSDGGWFGSEGGGESYSSRSRSGSSSSSNSAEGDGYSAPQPEYYEQSEGPLDGFGAAALMSGLALGGNTSNASRGQGHPEQYGGAYGQDQYQQLGGGGYGDQGRAGNEYGGYVQQQQYQQQQYQQQPQQYQQPQYLQQQQQYSSQGQYAPQQTPAQQKQYFEYSRCSGRRKAVLVCDLPDWLTLGWHQLLWPQRPIEGLHQ